MIVNHEASRAVAMGAARAATFEFADSLLGVLDHVERVGQPARLTLRGGRGQGVTIDPRRRLCDLGGVDVDLFCVVRMDDIVLSFGDEARQSLSRPRPLSELRWRAGYLGSGGRPVTGSSRFDVVRFTDWPNLARLPHDEDCVRVLALLTRHPTSIALARSITGIEMEKMNRIYAAGLAAGLVEVINRRQPVAAIAPAPAAGMTGGAATGTASGGAVAGTAAAGIAPARAATGLAVGHGGPAGAAGQAAPAREASVQARRASVHLASEVDEALPDDAAKPAAPGKGWMSSLFKRLRSL